MTMVSRLKKTAALLAAAAGITSAYFYAWGDVEGTRNPSVVEKPRTLVRLAEDLGSGRFSQTPLLSYDVQGEKYFALQIKPQLTAAPARPRDILVMIDTTASQAGFPLQISRRLTEAMINDMAPNDRIAIMTVNTPRASYDLTSGFQDAKAISVQNALKKLDEEYAAGASDLGNALKQGMQEFDNKSTRQQVILFLGDCESAYNPISEKERIALTDRMVAANIGFYAVPLGAPNPKNLHGLVTGTGGAVVRFVHEDAKQNKSDLKPVVKKINDLLSVPVLMPSEMKFAQAPAEVFPAKLPPLRADSPTLLIGRYEGKKPSTIELTISGKIAGQPTEVAVKEAMVPSASDNFFLPNLVTQWKKSDSPNAPALLRSDRTLALAYEQTRLALDEMLTQANWALGANQVEVARHLFVAAQDLKQDEIEAKAGLQLVDKLKSGKLSIQQFKDALAAGARTGVAVEKGADGKTHLAQVALEEVSKLQDAKPEEPKATTGVIPQKNNDDLLKMEQSRRNVLTQQIQTVVDETLSRGRRLLAEGDPVSAEALLKQQRDAIRSNPDIADTTRQKMLTSIESLIREVNTRGAEIVRRRQDESEAIARARIRLENEDKRQAEELRNRDRIAAFATLMRQARFEEQYREAEAKRQEDLASARPILPETTANYMIGQTATNLREFRELVRIREDRYLLTMMQVEKSHVPYPDEPPVHFPPSKVWREMLVQRKRFASEALSGDLPERARARMSFLQSALDTPIPLDNQYEGPLADFLDILETLASPPDSAKNPLKKVKILVDEKELGRATGGEQFDSTMKTIKVPKLSGASLGTVLRIVTSQLNASYWVRRDYIEITSIDAAIREKVVTAFSVADLVVPIPSAISQQALQQGLQVLGATFSLGGGGSPIAGAFGQPQFAVFGGGVGAGGFGAGGQAGGAGGAFQGLQNTFQGQSNVNLGAQGGLLGFGGGQLGQFGNLGGQFGFQGGTQHQILIELIKNVVARGEWLTVQSALITGNTNVNDPNAQGEETAIIPASELNSMGFYPPALALVVRGTSRVHASPSARLTRGGAGGMAMADGNGKNNVAKAEDNVIGDLANNLVEGKNKEGKALRGMAMSVSKDLKEDKLDLDPKKIWKEALAKADVRRSGVIVDTAGTLGVMNKFNHVVELLKESLRRGITVEPWAHEALAQAMEASQASDIDLERALTSAIDLDPKNAQAYIKASKAIAKTNPEQAIKLCVVAAKLEPELADPYMNAMAFAGDTKGKMNIDQLSWAANNVLNRDWASDTAEYHSEARAKLNDMIAQLTTQGRHEEAKKIQIMMDGDKRRDLVIQLIWTNGGERETAGLDLKVNEPAGSVCSVLNSQTASGGVLISDFYKKNDGGHVETYTASEAFSGEYSISVDKVWGRPLGNKATIKVTRNQGMPNEKTEMHTIDLSKPEVVKLSVQDGRRTKVASVPPPNFNAVKSSKPSREDLAVKKLEAIVEPVNAMEGGITSTAKPTAATKVKPAVDISWTGRVDSLINDGVEMVAKVVIGSNGEQKMVLTPLFNSNNKTMPTVKIDMIPGND